MAPKSPSLQQVSKGPAVAPPPACGTPGAETTHGIYNRRREQVRRAQRAHRSRQKIYVKSMEDEVVRLQEEWAAVLQESQRASEENLFLKEILMLSLSHPTYSQDESDASTLTSRMRRTQPFEVANMNPKDHFRPMLDNFGLPTSASTDMTSPNSNVTAPVPMDCSHNEITDTFDFFPPTSISHQQNHGYLDVQHGFTDEMDEMNFSSFTTLPHSPVNKPNTGHYTDFEPSLSTNDFIFSVNEPDPGTSPDTLRKSGPLEYYDTAQITPLGGGSSLTCSSNFACE